MRVLVIILFLFLTNGLIAQKNRSVHFDRALENYAKKHYAEAIEDFEFVFSKQGDGETVLYLADCYKKVGEIQESINAYKKAEQLIGLSDTIRINYAEVLKQNEQYVEAKKQYVLLSKNNPTKRQYEFYAQCCDSIISKKGMEDFRVVNLENINTRFSEIAPVVYKEGIVFSSNQENLYIEKKTANGAPYFDLYFGFGKDSLNPDRVRNFSAKINTLDHECCASFTKNFSKIFFTRTLDDQPGDGGVNTIKMFNATWEDNQWKDLKVFRFNDSTHSYGQPTVEGNEELFFFASDFAGGYGGTDLYVCFNIDGKWTNPVNLGPEVNSPYNELYPFFHEDGTLYFSSNRPEGAGGYDLYKSTENENGDYGNVENLYFPINSASDDYSIYWTGDYSTGYFSSNRKGGKGLEDIYRIEKK